MKIKPEPGHFKDLTGGTGIRQWHCRGLVGWPGSCLSASFQAKSSEEMGHWLGLLLSESGSKTDPEEFTYDYVDAERVSCIVSAAKTSLL